MGEAEGFDALRGVARWFDEMGVDWAFGGGWAIDLALNRVTRVHRDVDVVLWFDEQLAAQRWLITNGWQVQVARRGELEPWLPGVRVTLPEHNVWCRHPAREPAFVELLFNARDGDLWRYRRDPEVTMPLGRATHLCASGLPALVPEITLLYKSTSPDDPWNHADLHAALPALAEPARRWLIDALRRANPAHPWLVPLTGS